jgi:D-alanyl-D-alanine carboxypeptidase
MASEEPRKFAPGQGFFYSNTNFLLLGQIAAKVTGTPIGKLIRERIFEPLAMTHSSYPFTTALPAPAIMSALTEVVSPGNVSTP